MQFMSGFSNVVQLMMRIIRVIHAESIPTSYKAAIAFAR